MSESLAVKYRPKEWNEVSSQSSMVRILSKQVESGKVKNAYLFCGASGCGKTTIARIFADKLNNNIGRYIEIDGASNNGVDNVKSIIKSAQERSLDSKYKVYIMDECHSLTKQAWEAFLKCIEEPPTYTIFIFCTTDPQKIPPTILNRVQRFNVSRISNDKIIERLRYICDKEGFNNYDEACDYIAKISNGGMRDAITTLEKCASYDNDLSINNVIEALGNYSYDVFFDLMNSIIDGKEDKVIQIIESYYNYGNDLKIFVDKFFSFCIDISKFILFNDIGQTSLPSFTKDKVIECTKINDPLKYYTYVIDSLLNVKLTIRGDSNIKDTLIVLFLQLTRGR